jgi:hypothetical protein
MEWHRQGSSPNGDLSSSAAPVRRRSDEGEACLAALRASLGCGGSLGPVHGDGEAMRWAGDGELWRQNRGGRWRHLLKAETVRRGTDKLSRAFLI